MLILDRVVLWGQPLNVSAEELQEIVPATCGWETRHFASASIASLSGRRGVVENKIAVS